MLIVPKSIAILGCGTSWAPLNKSTLGWFCCVAREQSFSLTMQTSLWLFPFFDFCFKYLFYLFYWFQLCLLIYAHGHQIPLRIALSELIGSSCLFILTVGELHCWLNSSSSWMELFAVHSRNGAGLGLMSLVYLKVRIVFVLTILTTHLPSWPAAPRGTYEEEANDSDDSLSVSCFFYVYAFFICEEMKSLSGSHMSNSTPSANKGV